MSIPQKLPPSIGCLLVTCRWGLNWLITPSMTPVFSDAVKNNTSNCYKSHKREANLPAVVVVVQLQSRTNWVADDDCENVASSRSETLVPSIVSNCSHDIQAAEVVVSKAMNPETLQHFVTDISTFSPLGPVCQHICLDHLVLEKGKTTTEAEAVVAAEVEAEVEAAGSSGVDGRERQPKCRGWL
eukprot:gene2290-5283_t